MLVQLTISNFALVRKLDVDFQSGMTTITGETGAGKSIAIDALGLCLGNRSDSSMVRSGTSRTDICARFSLTDTPSARQWLDTYHLEDDHNECLLRRAIGTDGRSHSFINGTAVPLSQLRELGQHLIQVHGQHAHQLLLKPEHQKRLLDAYSDQPEILAKMKSAYQHWHQSRQALALHEKQLSEHSTRHQLLQYHLKELDELCPQTGEYEQIDAEYKRLANNDQLLSVSRLALQQLSDDEQQNILSQLYHVKQQLTELTSIEDKFSNLLAMLEEASIQIKEASDELLHYSEHLDIDLDRLDELKQKLSHYLNLSRKHHVTPQELPVLHQQLLHKQQLLSQQENNHSQLNEVVKSHYQQALTIADQLHQKRQNYAEELANLITESMHDLAMPHGKFTIKTTFAAEHLSSEGASHIEFFVTTNPGQPLQPLMKVASGGELSRIALAIQVITAQRMYTPTLIFDEVDVGISGPTAAIVGRLLRQLGESTQVICVTHLPQVAGYGHQHLFVSKQTDGTQTETHILPLDKQARLQELARLLGGSEVTKNTLANAKELLVS